MIAAALMLLFADVCDSGAAAARHRELERARPLLEQCVKLPASTVESFLLLAGVYQASGDEDGLFATAQAAIRRFPTEPRFYLAAATHAGRRKQFAEAIRILEHALKRWPEDTKMRALLASAYFGRGSELLDAGDHQRAADALGKATSLAPNDVEAQINLGRALHNIGRYAEALEVFEKVAALQPSYPLLAFHRGMSLHYLGEFDKAVEELTAVKDYPPALLVRGLALLSRGGFEPAAADLHAAVGAMPNDAAARYGYARALVRLGRLADAEPHLRKAMELDTTDAAPANLLVSVLRQLGRVEDARTVAVTAAERLKQQRTARAGEIRFQGAAR